VKNLPQQRQQRLRAVHVEKRAHPRQHRRNGRLIDLSQEKQKTPALSMICEAGGKQERGT